MTVIHLESVTSAVDTGSIQLMQFVTNDDKLLNIIYLGRVSLNFYTSVADPANVILYALRVIAYLNH